MKSAASILAAIGLLAGAQASAFELSSQDIRSGQAMPVQQEFNGFGCTGHNLSPQLSWKNAPAGTKSFAITVYDPDAPTGSGWWHWLVVNISASVQQVDSGSVPSGALQTRTDYGMAGYGGACPPEGDAPHRYIHTVWALDVERLPLEAQASGALVGYMLNQHQLGKAQLTATYQRSKH